MGKKINRRQFVQTTAAAGAAAAAIPKALFGQAPTMMTPKSVKPVVVSSNNGNKFKNGGSKTCVETAFAMITGARITSLTVDRRNPDNTQVDFVVGPIFSTILGAIHKPVPENKTFLISPALTVTTSPGKNSMT